MLSLRYRELGFSIGFCGVCTVDRFGTQTISITVLSAAIRSTKRRAERAERAAANA